MAQAVNTTPRIWFDFDFQEPTKLSIRLNNVTVGSIQRVDKAKLIIIINGKVEAIVKGDLAEAEEEVKRIVGIDSLR